ncbi:hypothetical protein JCM10213v2_008796 [Rhodosporidiobolus nylandii]
MPPLPELLQYLHTLDQPYASSFDDRLLLALLLALGAGERNLVIRVEPAEGPLADSRGQRKEWVKRVADEVQWYLADTLDTYISDLLSALRHHPQVEGRMLTARAAREVVETVRVWVAIGKGGALRLSSPSEAGDAGGDGQCEKQVEAREEEERKGEHAAPLVLPQDVLSVLLAVLGHRLALRKPRNEKSLFWGSERGALEERRKGRKVENVLFLYPIKGLRPIQPQKVELGELAFRFDRRFVLVSPKEDGSHECHLAADYPEHALLRQSIDWNTLTLTVSAPSGNSFSTPLQPSTAELKPSSVNLHSSPVRAFDVGEEAAAFFTAVSGGKASRLMYLNEGVSGSKYGRKVLGTISDGKDSGIAFQDCASYMIASSASLAAFSSQLGREMPIMPLRPNILLGPAEEGELKPWVEDYWGEITIAGKTTIRLTSNCVRCISLNIDYDTGKRLEGKGLPLQVLAKDRRVDKGSYSPVFGRYGFSHDVGHTISIGDPVEVTKVNKERTIFSWPGM